MPDGIFVTVSGIQEMKAALNALAADLRRNVVRQALRKAAVPLIVTAQANTPIIKQDTRRRVQGTILRNIKAFNSKRANGRGGVLGVYVTVKASRKDLKRAPVSGDPYYWRWVEGGHRIVPRSARTGTRFGKARYAKTLRARRAGATGSVKAYGFLLRAFRARGEDAIRIFSTQILARIARISRRK